MKSMDKVRVAVSIIVAAGLFGVCSVLYNNEELPLGIRIVVAVLAVLNLVCTILSAQDLAKRSKK